MFFFRGVKFLEWVHYGIRKLVANCNFLIDCAEVKFIIHLNHTSMCYYFYRYFLKNVSSDRTHGYN